MMARFSQETEKVLRSSGWKDGRLVDVSRWRSHFEANGIAMHDAAERFLSEFGGITVKAKGPGITRAREPFELNPLLAEGEEERFLEWGEEIGASLFPLGELDDGRYFLGIDEESRIYIVIDWVSRFRAGDDALEDLILGMEAEHVAG